MPQKRNSSEPPKVTPWTKASPALIIAAIFDLVRLFFEGFIVFGPALAGVLCTVVGSNALGGSSIATLVSGTACAAGATIVGVVGIEVTAPLGIVMAMVTGFAGWLAIGLWLLVTNARIFKENALWFVVSLAVSEVPFVGAVPMITIIVWRMYRTQIRIEKAALKKWEKENADAQLQERNQQVSQQVQFMQQKAANDAQYEQDDATQGAANDEAYDQEKASNDEQYDAETAPNIIRFPSERTRKPATGESNPQDMRKAA